MRYRPEIDGLRAVAILAVVLYHAGVFGTNGGYVGVDVFFVISGYLITGIVAAEVNDGRFSLVSFYERRARRILPALFVVIIATTSFTQLFFIDSDLEGFARSVGATAIFSSNILFWLESNYFASPSLYKPLLHTWSLGIEEQFYIFFPLLLLVAHKLLRSGLGLLILALAVVSLAANIWATGQSPNAAFYLIQFRAWELFLGAIVAIGVLPRVAMRGAAEVLAVTGIGLIAASVFLFDDSTEFPGVAATAPCVGACLIIWSNSHIRTIVGSFLSHKLLVGIGLISYSLYLWHWPILALSSYLLARPLHSVESLIAIGASMLAAIVSWRFVEQPFRGRASKYDRAQIFLASSVCACTMLAFGITGHFWI
jgi:peptidoglycan/LPS O-acetylase OafA/YrhL